MAKRRFWRRWRLLVLAIFAVIVVVLGYGFAETYLIEVEEYTFASPDVPASFDGLRIVFLADVHRGPFFSQDRVRSLVERANASSLTWSSSRGLRLSGNRPRGLLLCGAGATQSSARTVRSPRQP